jgi:hypothetical protein
MRHEDSDTLPVRAAIFWQDATLVRTAATGL